MDDVESAFRLTASVSIKKEEKITEETYSKAKFVLKFDYSQNDITWTVIGSIPMYGTISIKI